nr:MAG TPA: hypothetical protein [Caudoviricetes sp.]
MSQPLAYKKWSRWESDKSLFINLYHILGLFLGLLLKLNNFIATLCVWHSSK